MIDIETRVEWIKVLAHTACSQLEEVKAVALARAMEHESYQQRMKTVVKEGVQIHIYGSTSLFDFESKELHANAMRRKYSENILKLYWVLQEKNIATMDLQSLLSLDDEEQSKDTEYEEYKNNFSKQQDVAKDILKGEECKKGMFRCAACKSYDISTEQKQVRSADEGMDIFNSCNNCGKHWTIRG